jgi:TolA-binding protein/YHS domain-containing protein
MKKWILIACYFLVLIQSSHAALNITGKVVSVSQQPVSGALVSLVNAGYNTISDQNGIFKLTDANPVLKPTYNRTAAQYKFTIKGQTLQYYFPSNDLPCIVNIFSTSGKRIFTKNISQQEYGHIELFRHISQGQYVVQLETKKQQSVFSLQNLGTTLHLHDLTSRGPQISSFEKKATIISDTLLIQCASYTTRRIAIASYSLAIDTIVLSSITVNNDLATNADTLFTHAMLYFNNSVWDSASAFLSSYINKYPSGKSIESARYYYSRCLYETGNYSAARSGFIQFTKNYPSAALVDWVQYYIGQTWFGENNYDSARVWFSAVAQQYGDSLCGDDALYFTGRCDYELGKLSLAKSEFDILLSKYSLSSYRDGSSYHIGMCYYNLSSYDSAFTVFKAF